MRGEWSNGMLCSATEIGLGEDADGILILSETLTPGQPLTEALGLQGDWLFDLEVNANRPDALSMAGVARDVAARLGVRLRPARAGPPPTGGAPSAEVGLGRDRGRGLLCPLPGPGPAGRDHRPVADLAGQPHHPGGHAPHQQRGRRLQLRDARAGPAQPRLRPRHAWPAAACGSASPRRASGWSPWTTSSASFLADDVLICDGEDRRRRRGRRHGRRVHRDQRHHHQRAARGGLVAPDADRPHLDPAQPALRGLAGASSGGPTSGASTWPCERFCSLLAESGAVAAPDVIDERGAVPEHRPIRVRTDRVNLITGLDLDAPTIRGLLEPIGFTVGRRGRRRPGRRGAQLPSRRRRGDRRHRGGGPPPRLRQAAPDRCPARPTPVA